MKGGGGCEFVREKAESVCLEREGTHLISLFVDDIYYLLRMN
jgi:hypothetical protein